MTEYILYDKSFLFAGILGLFLAVFATGCATPEELTEKDVEMLIERAFEEYRDLSDQLEETAYTEDPKDRATVAVMEQRALELLGELPDLGVPLGSLRSHLADQKRIAQNLTPEIYLQTVEERQRDPGDRGFRIQIISTRDARLADEVREDFEEWFRSVSAPPYPHTYMSFQPPFYRVQVGDFRSRDKAMEFTEFLRLRYPDAWVVHSQIQPARVMR